MPRIDTQSLSEKFSGLKSRLGFSGGRDDDYNGYDDYDDYEEYDEYDEYDDYADDAVEDDYSDVTVRDAGSRRPSYSSSGLGSTRRSGVTYPSLVNRDDVRATTPTPAVAEPSRSASARRVNAFGRESVGRASDFAYSGTEYGRDPGRSSGAASAQGQRNSHHAGYESMFASTTTEAATPASAVGLGTHPSKDYDPYDAYQGTGSANHKPQRGLVVVSPIAYGEVESVARTLKAGDVVVLSLRNTPNQLAKRILDFSFGVASALDANVDCVADKVFVVARGGGLTDAERMKLRGQGVL